ncbi:unnamed protein product [Acanthoscelides obtectus]|uniref:Uncharacterized protein n=1 Tax=Acanthoscelides obtectus TaxID=200917 RepID=A0A9P0M810_ACAOB|nr:unnamed protein product [Acanthoscelides obtectus]CAK1641133.1 hypothetical protein AOBTE_LOCUS12182 [Acanthoscelides obtectus]
MWFDAKCRTSLNASVDDGTKEI